MLTNSNSIRVAVDIFSNALRGSLDRVVALVGLASDEDMIVKSFPERDSRTRIASERLIGIARALRNNRKWEQTRRKCSARCADRKNVGERFAGRY